MLILSAEVSKTCALFPYNSQKPLQPILKMLIITSTVWKFKLWVMVQHQHLVLLDWYLPPGLLLNSGSCGKKWLNTKQQLVSVYLLKLKQAVNTLYWSFLLMVVAFDLFCFTTQTCAQWVTRFFFSCSFVSMLLLCTFCTFILANKIVT